MCLFKVDLYPTFSRHTIAQTSLALVVWLNENVVRFWLQK